MLNITNIDRVRTLLALAREVRSSLPSLPSRWAKLLPWAAAATPWPALVGAYGAGVVTGAGAALLFAPMSGAELRALMKKRADAARTNWPQRVREVSESMVERAGDAADVAVSTAVTQAVTSATAAVDDAVDDDVDLAELTREELYARAQEESIPGRSKMHKDDLVEALRHA